MKMASISLPNHDIAMNQAPLHPLNHDIPMVLKTELGIEPFFFKFPVQPRFLTDFPVVDRFWGF